MNAIGLIKVCGICIENEGLSIEFSAGITSPSIIRIIKSRRMRWAGHVSRMGGEEECI
jgi:hypothetical protein